MNIDGLFAVIGDDVKKDMAKLQKVDVKTITDTMVKDQLAKGWIQEPKGVIRCLDCKHIFAFSLEEAKAVPSNCTCGKPLNFS